MIVAYVDESYNDSGTLAVGGWLCDERIWHHIEQAWEQRIVYENRISAKKGLRPLSRYHAADCSSLQNEFKGWDVDRQIRLVKKLIEIIGKYKPIGFVFGAAKEDLLQHYPELSESWKDVLYYLCLTSGLEEIGAFMRRQLPDERVAIIHDDGPFNTLARMAFDKKLIQPNFPDSRYFTTLASLRWQDCIALQPADLFAYEGFKLFHARLRDDARIRRSLRAILGKNVSLRAGWVDGKKFFGELRTQGVPAV